MSMFFSILFFTVFSWSNEFTEIQWSICENNPRLVIQKLNFPSQKATESTITYFDLPKPYYYKEGLSFRIKKKNSNLQSVVKVRNPAEFNEGSECEWDKYGSDEHFTCKITEQNIEENHPWTPVQKSFASERGAVDWRDLTEYGPYPVLSWQGSFSGIKLELESLRVDSKQNILELSARVSSKKSDKVYEQISQLLSEHGVQICQPIRGKFERLLDILH